MVSIGTIFSVLVVGAAIAGGYALYRNADKLGGALSRGVEQNITNPLGSYFDNLWNSFAGAPGTATQGVNPTTVFDPLPPAYGAPPAPAPGDLDYKAPTIPPFNNPYTPPSYTNPPASNLPNPQYPTPTPPPTAPTTPKSNYTSEWFTPGYYYVDYEGSKYDTQWKLTAYQAKNIAKAASAPGDAFFGIQYIGKSKLTEQAFGVFGKSKNYL